MDNATVPIYYESRIAKLSLNGAELPKVDSEFEEITEGEEEDRKPGRFREPDAKREQAACWTNSRRGVRRAAEK